MADKDALTADNHVVADEDAHAPALSVPDPADTGEGGKLKMVIQLVKKCLGVTDIANMRMSLPASILEPVPGLEYWQLLDRPDLFAAINDAEHPFERMLSVVRFTFSKDLKHSKACKPYNSVLGEVFRTHWDVPPIAYADDLSQTSIPLPHSTASPYGASTFSESASVKSGRSSKSTRSGFSAFSKTKNSTPSTSIEANVTAQMSNLSLSDNDTNSERLRVAYVTEQVSHHPPVSVFYASCPQRHIEVLGIDQVSAKVSGTTIKIVPGTYNQGIYVNINGGNGEGERYHITQPVAFVNGILRGNFFLTIGEKLIITCTGGKPGPKFRTIIEYKEEPWIGKAHFLVEGVIHVVHEGETQHEEWTKVKHVPADRVVAVFDGSWRGHIRWRRVGAGSYPNAFSTAASSPSPSHEHLPTPKLPPHSASRPDVSRPDSEYSTLIDIAALKSIPKEVRPIEKQFPNESRKLWMKVTDNLLKKEYSEATREKVIIEQRQRDATAERKRKGIEFVPRYFEKDLSAGYSHLSEEGWKILQEEIEEPSSYGADA